MAGPRDISHEDADETDIDDIQGLSPEDDEGVESGAEGENDDQDEGSEADDEVDHAADDGSEEDEGRAQRQVADRGGRAGKAIAETRRRARDAEERANRLERELQEARNRPAPPPQQPQETPAQEAEKLALMTAEERMEYRLNKSLEGHRREIAAAQFQTRDIQDKGVFEVAAAKNPLIARFGERVEKELTKLRQQGGNADRLVVAQFLIGKAVMDKSAKATTSQKQKGQQAIRRETVRSPRSGSDTGSVRREGATTEAQRRRIENLSI